MLRGWPWQARGEASGPLPLAVAAGTALLLVVIAFGLVRLLEESRDRSLRAAEQALDRSARVAESIVNRQLLQADSALATLPELFDAAGLTDTPESALAAGRILRGIDGQSYAFRDLVLLRPDGSVWAAGRPRSRRQPSPAGVELGSPPLGSGAVLAGPVRDPRLSDWVLYLSRPVAASRIGSLRAVAEIPIATLVAPLAELGHATGVRVMVRWADGRLIASLPHDELAIGTRPNPPATQLAGLDGVPAEVELAPGRPALAVDRGTIYPDVHVLLTMDMDHALAEWRRDRDRRLFLGLVGAFLISALGAALLFALRRKEQLEAERRQSRRLLEDAIDGMSDGFVMWDADDRLVTCNQHYRELYSESAPYIVPGARFEDIMRKGADAGQYPQAGDDVDGFVRRITAWHQACSGSLERLLPDGRWLLVTERRTANGGIVGIRTDITPLKQASAELAAANQRFDEALSNMPHGLMMADADGRVIVCNTSFAALFGLGDPSALHGLTLDALFAAIERSGSFGGAAATIHRRQRAHLAEGRPARFNAAAADGRCVEVTQRPMETGGFVAIYEDVTDKQRAERRIAFMAHHDALTELPNRVFFRSELEIRVGQIRDGEDEVAVLYLDLDGFKEVNDTLGHPVGDALLAAVARRLRATAEPDGLIARLGGDEFAVAITGREVSRLAAELGQRLVAAMRAPFDVAERSLSVGVSVGAAVARSSEDDADTLLKRADMALYAAKAGGRGGFIEFQPEMETRLHARLELRHDVEQALAAGDFELAYQPLFELASGAQVGFEALLRWNHRTRGWVPPGDFIPLAEETGLIVEIGAWALARAAADASGLPGGLRVAVNVSPVQLRSGTIADTVAAALARSGLPADRLELEITESALLGDHEQTLATLHRLRGLGVRIVLDDFGTGFSSLSHLRMFPFHKIKIDQLFVRDATTRDDCSAIISSVVELANRLGMTTTAEGIETAEQLGLVRRLGCHEGQGFLLGRPAPLLTNLVTLASEPKPLSRPGRVARAAARGARRST